MSTAKTPFSLAGIGGCFKLCENLAKNMKKIRTAVIPVAGMGTRLLPVTKAVPKELLPIFDRPAVQLIAEEAVAAGMEKIIFVIHPTKETIRAHFTRDHDLHEQLKSKKKHDFSDALKKIEEAADFRFVYQHEPLGDGHAVLQAMPELDADESFVVLFGDDVVDNNDGPNAVEQLIEKYERHGSPVVLLQEVPREDTKMYGVVAMDDDYRVHEIVEKPDPADAPSNFAVVGKYILTPRVLEVLREIDPQRDGEIRLSGAFDRMVRAGEALHGRPLDGKRFDTGHLEGLLEAALHFFEKSKQ